MRAGAFTAVVVAALALASSAAAKNAKHSQLWEIQHVDQIATDVAGFPVQVALEDDEAEWESILASFNDVPPPDLYIYGFSAPFVPPGDPLYNVIFLSPPVFQGLAAILQGQVATLPPINAALAMHTLVHEDEHLMLRSGDEGRVDACALQIDPKVFEKEFGIAPTVTQTISQTITTTKRVRVKVHGHWVWRTKHTTKTVNVTQTSPNPVFQAIVAADQQLHASAPPPYNSGTCT